VEDQADGAGKDGNGRRRQEDDGGIREKEDDEKRNGKDADGRRRGNGKRGNEKRENGERGRGKEKKGGAEEGGKRNDAEEEEMFLNCRDIQTNQLIIYFIIVVPQLTVCRSFVASEVRREWIGLGELWGSLD